MAISNSYIKFPEGILYVHIHNMYNYNMFTTMLIWLIMGVKLAVMFTIPQLSQSLGMVVCLPFPVMAGL